MLSDTIQNLIDQGVIDMQLVSERLDEIYRLDYTHQKKAQKDKVKFERYDINMASFKYRVVDPSARVIRKRYASYVEFDMVSSHRRVRFKRSDLVNKELSIHDIKSRRDIFDYNYLAFIDGKVVDFIHVIPTDTGVEIIFNEENGVDRYGLSKEQFDYLKRPEKILTIFFIPNNEYGAYTVDAAVLKAKGNYLSLKDTGIIKALGTEVSYIAFVNNSDFNFGSTILDYERSKDIMKFYTNNTPTNNKVHINVFGFRNLKKVVELDAVSDQFVLDYENKMPIPDQNIIIFRKNADGNTVFAHDIELIHYYPNIYRIKNRKEEKLFVYVFYANDDSQTVGFKDDLEYYYKVRGYKDIPELALNYQPPYFNYSIQDFRESSFYPDHTAYKMSKFSEWVDANPELIREYLKQKLADIDGYYINIADIDLTERKRTNNHDEITDVYQHVEFEEERYYLALRNDDTANYKNIQMFIDGLPYDNFKRYKRGKYEYYYIETSWLKPDSVIEIEEYSTYRNEVSFTVMNTNMVKEIPVGDFQYINKDIYVMNMTDGLSLSPEMYKLYYMYEGKKHYITLGESVQYIPTESFFIELSDYRLYEKEIKVVVDKNFHLFINNTDIALNNPKFRENIGYDVNPNKFLSHVNHRLVSPSKYVVTNHGPETGFVFSPGVAAGKDSSIRAVYMPYVYKTILEEPDVPAGGIVNLHDYIDKPFDLKWHDVYVNGRRLNQNQIEYISPYIIRLKNIASSKNLIIMERNVAKEAIYSEKPSKSIMDTLFQEDTAFADLLTSLGPIQDIEEEIVDELIDAFLVSLAVFYNEVMLKDLRYINPDLKQITAEHKSRTPYLFKDGQNVLHIEPTRGLKSGGILRIGGKI